MDSDLLCHAPGKTVLYAVGQHVGEVLAWVLVLRLAVSGEAGRSDQRSRRGSGVRLCPPGDFAV